MSSQARGETHRAEDATTLGQMHAVQGERQGDNGRGHAESEHEALARKRLEVTQAE